MIALENRIDESAVDGAALLGQELGKLLAPLFERRRAFSRPDERVERETRYALGMLLCEQRRAQSARRNAVNHDVAVDPPGRDVVCRGGQVIGAIGDIAGDVSRLVGAA